MSFSSKIQRKTAPVLTRKALISRHFLPTSLSRFANRTRISGLPDDRARHATSQEISSFIITNNPGCPRHQGGARPAPLGTLFRADDKRLARERDENRVYACERE